MAGVCSLVILKWKRSNVINRSCVFLVEYDSMDEARQFYFSDGYTAAKLVREKASEADLILVEGV